VERTTLPGRQWIYLFQGIEDRFRVIADKQPYILQAATSKILKQILTSLTCGNTEAKDLKVTRVTLTANEHYNPVGTDHIYVHAVYVNHWINSIYGLLTPLDQLLIEPSHQAADGLMADRAAEYLFGQWRQRACACAKQVNMAKNTRYIRDPSLVAVKDYRGIHTALSGPRYSDSQLAVWAAQAANVIAVAMTDSGLCSLIPAGLELVLHLQFKDLLGQVSY
jgi:hypothetical protein